MDSSQMTPPETPRALATAAADGLRAAMAEGDRSLPTGSVDRMILHSIVAGSAARAAAWVQTRVPGGTEAAEPLELLVPVLQAGDKIGPRLDQAESVLLRKARTLVTSVFITGTLPIYGLSVLAFIAGGIGFALDSGSALGKALVPAAAGGGGITFAIVRSLHAAPAVVQATGEAAGSLWHAASTVGSRAEQVFRRTAGPSLDALYAQQGVPVPDPPTVAKLRGAAQLAVGSAYALLAVAATFFAFGIWNGIQAAVTAKYACPVKDLFGNCVR